MSERNDDPVSVESDASATAPKPGITRRLFLKTSGAAVASTGAATVGTMTGIDRHAAAAQEASPVPDHVMDAENRAIRFFNFHEASTVDALVSRILPGSADDPGAHEAGVVYYIDAALSGTNEGLNLKTYMQGPFLVVSEEPTPVEAASTRDIYEVIQIPADQASRYGYQSVLTPQESYRRGLGFVDAYSQETFQQNFVDLSEEQQDEVLTAMDEDSATGFDGPSARAFFTRLRNDTIEGMFGDPMYGGNRDLVGWKLIGFPGAQRLYTPDDIKNPDFTRAPQSLAMMMANEGR
jgi:hypothetical protein